MKKNLLFMLVFILLNIPVYNVFGDIVSGKITKDGNPLANVIVKCNQTPPHDTSSSIIYDTTDINGKYSFNIEKGSNIRLTPLKSNYSFSPYNTYFTVRSDTIQNFEATHALLTISGSIKTEDNIGIKDVTIIITGPTNDTTTTDANGNYLFNVQAGGTYIITPHKTNYEFSPPMDTVINITSNQIVNFIGKLNTINISGTITDTTNQPLSNVKVIISGSTNDTTTTDATGGYSFNVVKNGSFLIVPQKENYIFEPSSQIFTNLAVDTTADFIGIKNLFNLIIKIYSKQDSLPIKNIKIIVMSPKSLDTLKTNSNGIAEIKVQNYLQYTITPIDTNYIFEPDKKQVTINNQDKEVIFYGNNQKVKISGNITDNKNNTPTENVIMVLRGISYIDTTFTDKDGYYEFSAFKYGNYTLTPIKQGMEFDPQYVMFSSIKQDTVINFKSKISTPILLSPKGGNISPNPRFYWAYGGTGDSVFFKLKIYNDNDTIFIDSISDTTISISGLKQGVSYYWTACSILDDSTSSDWALPLMFNTKIIKDTLSITPLVDSQEIEDRNILLLIHGWNSSERAAPPATYHWDNFIDFYNNSNELKDAFVIYNVNYYSNFVSIEKLSSILKNKIEEIDLVDTAFANRKLFIIGYSMGGIIAQSFMKKQTFSQGKWANQQCGNRVKLLITLGIPIHGSPLTNGPARNEKVDDTRKATLALLDQALFNDVHYNDNNRAELHWDNFNNLSNLDYDKFPEEKNTFLEDLNNNTNFDNKIIVYLGRINGKYNLPPYSDNNTIYSTSAYILKEDMGLESDGLVPSIVQNHSIKNKRMFDDYNHDDIVNGKESDSNLLFLSIKEDLLSMASLIIFNPKNRMAINHNTNLEIQWSAPDDIKKINIAYSIDNKKTFHEIATDIDASLNKYIWKVPDTNADSCYIKIWSGETIKYNKIPFNIFHNRIFITTPKKDTIWSHGETDTIKWEYTGLIDTIKIDYIDNDTNRKINLSAKADVKNTPYIWNILDNTPLSYRGTIEMSITQLKKGYIYPDDYEYENFVSDTFKLFPEKKITLISPDSNYVDIEGISGQYLFIDSTITIKWKSQGNIKNVNIYLINKETNEIKTIVENFSQNLQHYSNNSYNWKVPNTPGDNFTLKIESSSDPSIFDTTNYNLRIRKKGPKILKPAPNTQDVLLYPSFTWNKIDNALSYKISIYNCKTKELVFSEDNLKDTTFTIPDKPENELKINTEYCVTVKAFYNSLNNTIAKSATLIKNNTISTFNYEIKFKTENKGPEDNLELLEPENNAQNLTSPITFKWTRPKRTEKFYLKIIYNGKIFYTRELSDLDTVETIDFVHNFLDTVYWEITAENSAGEVSKKRHFRMLSPIKKIGDLVYNCPKWDDTDINTYKGTGRISIKKEGSSDSIVVTSGYLLVNKVFSIVKEGYGTVIYYINNKPVEIFRGYFNVSGYSIIPYNYEIKNHFGLPSKNQIIDKINLLTYDIRIKYQNSEFNLPHHGFYTIKDNSIIKKLYFDLIGIISLKKDGHLEGSFKNTTIEIAAFKFNLSDISLYGDINYSWIQADNVRLNATKNYFFNIDLPMSYKNPMVFTIDGKKAGFANISNNKIDTDIETLFPAITLGTLRLGQPYMQFVYLDQEKIWALDGFSIFFLPFKMITPPSGNFMRKAAKLRYPIIFASFKAYNEPPYIRYANLQLYDANIMVTPLIWFSSFNATLNMEANSNGKLKELSFKGYVGFGLGPSYWSFIINGSPGIEYTYKKSPYTNKIEIFGELKALFGVITLGEARLSIKSKKWGENLESTNAKIINQTTLKGVARVAFPTYSSPWIDVGIAGGFKATRKHFIVKNKYYFNYDFYFKGYGKIGIPKHSIKKFGVKWPKRNYKLTDIRIEFGKFKKGGNTLLGAQARVALGTYKYPKCKCSGKWYKPKSWKCKCRWKRKTIKARAFVDFKKKRLSVGTNFYKLKEFRRSVALRRLKALSYMKNSGKLSKRTSEYYNYVKNYYYSEEGDSLFFDIQKTNEEKILVSIRQFSDKRPKVVLCSPSDTLYYSEDIIAQSPDVLGDSGYIMVIDAEPGTWKAFVFDIDSQDDYEINILDVNSPPELTINSINIKNDSIIQINYTALDSDNNANIQFFLAESDTSVGIQINTDTITENDGIGIYDWNYKNISNGDYYIYGIINDGDNNGVTTKLWGPYHLESKTELLPPQNIVISKNNELIDIKWDDVTSNNNHFNLYIGKSPNNLSDTITNINNNYYSFKPESDTTTYYFKLKTFDLNNNESDFSKLYSFKSDTIEIDTIPPNKPNAPEVEVFLSDSTESFINIKIQRIDGASGYIVYIKNSVNDSSLQFIDIGDNDSVKLVGLEKGFSYDISIIAYDNFKNKSEPSPITKINYYNMEDIDEDDMIDDREILYFGGIDVTDDKYGDFDDDGLSNIYEMDTLFTNPNNKDTDNDKVWDDVDPNPLQYTDSDGDNMPDDWELFNKVKKPDRDLDFDGLPNIKEFELGTDPQNQDTDGGGRTDGDEITRGLNPLDKTDDYSDKKIEIKITDFSGTRISDKIIISWNAENDQTIQGYNLLKYTSTDSIWLQINPDLIETLDDSSDIHYYEYIDSLGIDSTVSYKYKLIAVGYYNNTDTIDIIEIPAIQTAINEQNNLLIKKLKLYQNYPNPFNSGTKITFEIPTGELENSHVTLTIYNMLGQKIKELVNGIKPHGRYTVYWDGKDKNGQKLESGLYIYQLKIGQYIIKKKMIIIK